MAWVEHITGRTWPVVITGPGQYRTRSGKRVVIDQYDRPTTSSWPHAGHIIHREKPERTEWQTWQSNGQIGSVGESPLDIVGRWAP